MIKVMRPGGGFGRGTKKKNFPDSRFLRAIFFPDEAQEFTSRDMSKKRINISRDISKKHVILSHGI